VSTVPDYQLSYETRSWQVYELPLTDPEMPKLSEDNRISWCNSDSQRARELEGDPARFYVDYELASVDLSPRAGSTIGKLKDDWRGHAAGTLAITSYEKIHDGLLVVLIESVEG
jgi:hypothetical protein